MCYFTNIFLQYPRFYKLKLIYVDLRLTCIHFETQKALIH